MERWMQMILLIPEDDFITSKQLSEALGVSDRTVYNDIAQLNQYLQDKGAQLVSKPRHGIKLLVTDRGQFLSFLHSVESKDMEMEMGESSEARVDRIMKRMLLAEEPIRMDDLCDELYISRSTLKNDMKKVRRFLNRYNLEIDSRSYAGMLVRGTEINRRRCLTKIDQILIAGDNDFLKDDMQEISSMLKDLLKRHSYRMAAYFFQNFVNHIYVSIMRIRRGKEVTIPHIPGWKEEIDPSIKALAEAIAAALEQRYNIHFSQSEFQYIMLHLDCKKVITDKQNTIVTADVYEAVTMMLQEVRRAFDYDFRHDFELVTSLATHIFPLRLRMLYGMPFDNPMLSEIRDGDPLAYDMAQVACGKLSEIYGGTGVVPDEVAYIALHFHMALERFKKKHKKNVLIVCGTGKGSAMLIAYRVKEKYGNYLNVIGMHEALDLQDADLSHVDYILTTVPIREPLPVPVIEISKPFAGDESPDNLHKYFHNDSRKILRNYFSRELFISHMREGSKEAILKRMCSAVSSVEGVPGDFYEHVMRREEIGGTDFGNGIAIPHPDCPMGSRSFAAVGILDQAVPWNQEEVQIVFLLSMKDGGDRNLHLFYRAVSRLLSRQKLIRHLIQVQTYEELIDILVSLAVES